MEQMYYPSYNAIVEYIEKAKQEKVTSLDLSNAYYLHKDAFKDEVVSLPLGHIPPNVFEIETLEKLIIDRQEVNSI